MFLLVEIVQGKCITKGTGRYSSIWVIRDKIKSMLPDMQLNDILRLRKPHPCGSYEWTVVRLGADIGLVCKGCGRRVMLTRRELSRRLKTILPKENHDQTS